MSSSASGAPTSRARASACSHVVSDSSKRQASINPRASAASARARSSDGLGRHELDHALERDERSVRPSALVEVVAELVVEARRT